MTTPNLALDELTAAQSSPHVTVNSSFRRLDSLVQIGVLAIQNAPPGGTPADGDRYIVDTSPTGAWSGHAKAIAYWVAGSFNEWRFVAPKAGWMAYVLGPEKVWIFKGSTSLWTVTTVI